jgi:hypothetical protein
MRLITAITLFSATVMATNHGEYGHGEQQKGYEYGQEQGWGEPAPPHPVDQATWTPSYEPPAQQYTPPPAPVETYPPAEHTSAPPAHEAPPPEHTPPPYVVDVQPPPEGKMVHTVTVGGDAGLVYSPPHIQAEIGDTVHFIFLKQNHSVTQSTFAKPCNKLDIGEDSGLQANPNNTVVPAPTWEYVVKEKEPTWWYCKQRTGTHCGKGMVFAINPTAEKTFDKFREVAIQINGTDAVTSTAPPAPEKTVEPKPTVTLTPDTPTDAPEPPKDAPVEPPKDIDVPYTAPGWNEQGNPSACNCACFCGVGSFPQGDGWGSYGGVGGSLMSPW